MYNSVSKKTKFIILSIILVILVFFFAPRSVAGKLKSTRSSDFKLTLVDHPYVDESDVKTYYLNEEDSKLIVNMLRRCYMRPALSFNDYPLNGFFPKDTKGDHIGIVITDNQNDNTLIYIETRHNITVNNINYVVYTPAIIDELVKILESLEVE